LHHEPSQMYVHVSLNVHHCDNRDFICADDQHTNDRPDDNDECYTHRRWM
jgi:hypothetical protein